MRVMTASWNAQWNVNREPTHLLLSDPAKVRGDDGVLDDDEYGGRNAVVVKRASGRVVAKVGSEAFAHRGGPDGAAFQFEEERPRFLAVPEHEEGIGMDGSRTVLVLEVPGGAVGRVQLGDFPALIPRRRYR